jgi:hypothetical protein
MVPMLSDVVFYNDMKANHVILIPAGAVLYNDLMKNHFSLPPCDESPIEQSMWVVFCRMYGSPEQPI